MVKLIYDPPAPRGPLLPWAVGCSRVASVGSPPRRVAMKHARTRVGRSRKTKVAAAIFGIAIAGGAAYGVTNWVIGLSSGSSGAAQAASVSNLTISAVASPVSDQPALPRRQRRRGPDHQQPERLPGHRQRRGPADQHHVCRRLHQLRAEHGSDGLLVDDQLRHLELLDNHERLGPRLTTPLVVGASGKLDRHAHQRRQR